MSKLSHSPTHCTKCKGPTDNCAHNCPMDGRDTEEGGIICTCCTECLAKCIKLAEQNSLGNPGDLV